MNQEVCRVVPADFLLFLAPFPDLSNITVNLTLAVDFVNLHKHGINT